MKKTIPVYGMHCKACELLIEDKLSEISSIKVNKISSSKNSIDLEYKYDSDLTKIDEVIKELGYTTTEKKIIKNNLFDYIIIFLIFLIFGILYYLFKDIKIFDNILKNNNLSFFIILLIGLVASMSSCLAITGGIVLGFSKYIDNIKNTNSHLKTQLNFHIGRIVGFSILGGILGIFGGYFSSFGILNKFLLFLAGIFMIYMGLNILNIFPSISKFGISMPKIFGNKILNIKNPSLAPIIGALTFFLPCGFTQSMQIYAVSSSSFLQGAMIMGTFALGTMPVLFLVGFGSSYFKDKNFNYINKVIGVLVVYFGIFIFSGFLNMFNLNISNNKPLTTTQIENLQDFKEVSVIHNGSGFDDVVLQGAKSYKLIINPESDGLGCMFELTIPGIDNNAYPVKKGVPIIININNPKPGVYKAICTAMGMKHGNIIIK